MSRWQALYRVCVQVPLDAVEAVLAGALEVDERAAGGYADGAWISASGQEQFRPLAGARPALGQAGERVRVASVRLEFLLPRDEARLQRFIDGGIRPHHPWEAPVILVEEVRLALP